MSITQPIDFPSLKISSLKVVDSLVHHVLFEHLEIVTPNLGINFGGVLIQFCSVGDSLFANLLQKMLMGQDWVGSTKIMITFQYLINMYQLNSSIELYSTKKVP